MSVMTIVLDFLHTIRSIPLRGPSELFLEIARKVARVKYGVNPNPMGLRNKKVNGPSTYRPLESTCPSNCVYFHDCYANGGHVTLAARRAEADILRSLFAVAMAIACSEEIDHQIRLHVSGDFLVYDEIDHSYINGLVTLGAHTHHVTKPWAWSYTHVHPRLFEPLRLLLVAAGIEVMYSDQFVAGGAIVWPFDRLNELRVAPDAWYVKCPAQTRKIPCSMCNLCKESRTLGICIVFEPQGFHKRETLALAERVARDAGMYLPAENRRLVSSTKRKVCTADPVMVQL